MPDSIVDPQQVPLGTGNLPDTILRFSGVTKTFGPTRALQNVDLDIVPGEVHALFGHNGAGKSTLIKTLAGAIKPDAGTVEIDGTPVDTSSPVGPLKAGVRVVYQELALFGSLSVAENLLGASGGGQDAIGGFVRHRRIRQQAREMLKEMQLNIAPDALVDQLPIGEQQMVEIGRALFSGAKIVVLDEPTSALSPGETKVLFRLVHQLTAKGITFILISHFLDEILEHADRVTVMRSGTAVKTLKVSETTAEELISVALGEDAGVLAETFSHVATTLPEEATGPVVLRARHLQVLPTLHDVSFELGEGEILAFYGELGCGHEAIGEAIFGQSHPHRGSLTVLGYDMAGRDEPQARLIGVGYIPADRRQALALDQPIFMNITIAALSKMSRWLMRPDRERTVSQDLIDRLKIRGARTQAPIRDLSGGNQQKALIARWLVDPPRVLVLAEPTRAMDVGAKSDVLRTIETLREQGVSLIIITSEPETALAAADRIITISRGRIAQQFSGASVKVRDLVEAVA